MSFMARFFLNLLVFLAIVILLAACASSGPSADPAACRGTAFPINASQPIQPTGAR